MKVLLRTAKRDPSSNPGLCFKKSSGNLEIYFTNIAEEISFATLSTL